MKKLSRMLLCAATSIAFADLAGAATNTDIRSMMNVLDNTAPAIHNYFALTGTVHTIQKAESDPSTIACFVVDDGKLLISVFNRTEPSCVVHPGDRIVVKYLKDRQDYPVLVKKR